MSTTPQQHNDNQEIDLSQISRKIGNLFEKAADLIFLALLFAKRNIIIILVLLVGGYFLGRYMDSTNKSYDNQIIVSPNFSSYDYLYAKINLINAKNNEGDSLFLKNVVGIKNPDNFHGIEIEPITDIYRFIGGEPVNFEFVKLLAEDNDINKVVEDDLTSRNYIFHNINFSTGKPTTDAETVAPILKYLNDSDYYRKIQKQYVENVHVKMRQNDSIIAQINMVLNNAKNPSKSNNLVYYNENTQLNEVIKTKNELNGEQGSSRMELVGLDQIIKKNSATINIENHKGLNGKRKLVLPVLLLMLFFGSVVLIKFYKRQLAKSKA